MSFGMGMKEKQTNPIDSHPKNWKANMTAGGVVSRDVRFDILPHEN